MNIVWKIRICFFVLMAGSCKEDEAVEHSWSLEQFNGLWRFESLSYNGSLYDNDDTTPALDACQSGFVQTKFVFTIQYSHANNYSNFNFPCDHKVLYYSISLGPKRNYLKFEDPDTYAVFNFKVVSLEAHKMILVLEGSSMEPQKKPIGGIYTFAQT